MLYAFADYLDEIPNAVNDFRTSVRKPESEREKEVETNGRELPALDGKFWETFAELVANKTAEKLIEKLKATAF
jgi:hypothetical protein